MEIFLERSSKGQLVVLYQDYVYTKHETRTDQITWKCSRGHKRCPGTMTTDMFLGDPKSGFPHNHEANCSSLQYKMRKWMKTVRKMAKSAENVFRLTPRAAKTSLHPNNCGYIMARKSRSV